MNKKTKKPKRKRDIPVYMIKGEYEFGEAFGILDNEKQAELRSKGMPCMNMNGQYMYDPDEVKEWFKKTFKVERPIEL